MFGLVLTLLFSKELMTHFPLLFLLLTDYDFNFTLMLNTLTFYCLFSSPQGELFSADRVKWGLCVDRMSSLFVYA